MLILGTQVLLRGCRCIEIDVFDGETDSKSSETASISTMETAPKPEHHRHLSGLKSTSLAHFAVDAKEMAGAQLKLAKQKISEKTGVDLGVSNLKIDERGKSTDNLAVENSPLLLHNLDHNLLLLLIGVNFQTDDDW